MQKLPIAEATDAQLRTFAVDVQQLDKVPTERGGIIAALIESGHTQDFIFVDGLPTEAAEADEAGNQPFQALPQFLRPLEEPTPMPTTGFGYWKNSPMVTCRVTSTDRPGGNEPAHPSINGSPPLVIQRNKLVSIPLDFYLVLQNAGGTAVRPGADASDDLVYQDYKEYPMIDVVLPSAEAVEKWQRFTSGHELGRPKAKAA